MSYYLSAAFDSVLVHARALIDLKEVRILARLEVTLRFELYRNVPASEFPPAQSRSHRDSSNLPLLSLAIDSWSPHVAFSSISFPTIQLAASPIVAEGSIREYRE